MSIITDTKSVYPEFKFFKNIYVSLNVSEYCTFRWEEKTQKIFLSFSNDSNYYLIAGEISGNTEFFNWLKTINGGVSISLSSISIISKTLKKNAVSIEFENGNYFIFKYLDKESGNELSIKLEPNKYDNTIDLIHYNLSTEFELSNDFLKNEICTIFRNEDGNLTSERTKDKILEIPTARIKSLLKNSKNKLLMSDRDINGNRYVAITSSNDEINLSLTQIFKTI